MPHRRRSTTPLHRAMAVLAAVLLVALCRVLALVDGDALPAAEFRAVAGCAEPARDQPYRAVALSDRMHRLPDDTRCEWQPLQLPTVRAAAAVGYAVDRRPVAVQWIRAAYTVPAAGGTTAVLMRGLSGEGWTLWVDGVRTADNLDDWRMTWNRPLVASLPPQLAPAGKQIELVIGLAYGATSGYSMTPLLVGPQATLEGEIRARQAWQTTLPQICTAAQLLIGTFFFAFWCARPSETAHLLLAAASVAWSVSNLQYVMPRHDDPALDRAYDSIVSLATAWVMWLVYAAVGEFDSRRARWVPRALPVYVLCISGLAIVASVAQYDASVALQVGNSTVAVVVTALIVQQAIRGTAELRLIAAALTLALAAGVHDVALIAHWLPASGLFLLPASSLLVTGAFLYALQRRYVRAIDGQERLAATLNERLAQREAELTANHQRLRALERVQALAEERQRLMGDIHDGLGSTLVATMVALERQHLGPHEAAAAVRDCLDDMRLMIDSLDPTALDVGTLLATLRWRLADRLSAAGLHIDWQWPALQPLPWLDAPHALQLLRLLQEVLANALKHARARRLSVVAHDAADMLVLTMADDGRGFDVDHKAPGRGFVTMHARARSLGASLSIRSSATGGTQVSLRLPRHREGHGRQVEPGVEPA